MSEGEFETARTAVESVSKGLFVGGSWRDAEAGGTFAVEDPATGKTLCSVADATPADGMAALAAAVAAQASWAATAPRERGEILRRAHALLLARREEFAALMTAEMGKPIAESLGEVAYAAEFFRWFAEEAVRIGGDHAVAPDGGSRFLVMRQPVGPSLLVTPWNFPMAMGTRKIGPAVAAGCTMVLKPAEQTPLSALALADVLREAGLPDGVLNVVPTSAPGPLVEPLLRDGRIRKLSFTGSTEVGRLLLGQCAGQVLRVSLELGGNAPFIVFADADLDAAVEGAMLAKMRNIGEACTAANRFYAEAPIAEEFTRRLAERMGGLTVGPGLDPANQVGPLIDEAGRQKVAALVDDAVSRGATIRTGGSAPAGPGYFYPPTVLSGVPADARMRHEEIFGPVAPVTAFDTEEQALAWANDTEYGLVAYVYTRDLDRALRVSEALETGMVGLNRGVVSNPAAPFGGVKHSGLGREGGKVGIEEFLETKYVALG
ncbi:NAD-dependent succinate-semialdehyde dehydrogenase [Actinoallomurus iriomotensis]|uniref:NAD-dependent succinate-semialdehyde dehydrogenase n=1 Tax=Actinoallomurus iriomotensis TaxID=478107 RepID=A0A9W6S5W6_9ACTN|nr:NAD-dependent succinate-semialdehyde dehydrogenase [Actinoallomurus iriomotensis]GLY87723.1 NAD-dependent succinate-semialdehyde dehydrogenase [Actinoallomurus iriomotensis]